MTRLGSLRFRHERYISAVAFSPDGKMLVTGGLDKVIHLWEASTGKLLKTLEGHKSAISSLAISHDGMSIASGSFDKTARIWDIQSGQAVHVLKGHEAVVGSVDFSVKSRLVVTAGWDGTVRLWETTDGREIRKFKHTGKVQTVAFSPDGKHFASAGEHGAITIRTLPTGRIVGIIPSLAGKAGNIAFSPDGRQLTAGFNDGTVCIFTVPLGKKAWSVQAHEKPVTRVAFSPNGKLLASGGRDGVVHLWDLKRKKRIFSIRGRLCHWGGLAFSPDGKTLAMASGARRLRLIRLSDCKPAQPRLAGHTNVVHSLAYSPDGKMLASCSRDLTVRVWDLAAARRVQVLRGHQRDARAAAFSPDGKLLASVGGEGRLYCWNVATGSQQSKLQLTTKKRTAWADFVRFSADTGTLTIAGRVGLLWQVDQKTNKSVSCKDLARLFLACDQSDDRTLFAAALRGGIVGIWHTRSGKRLLTIRADTSSVRAVDLSPDGYTLAAGGWDGAIRLWELATGREIDTFDAHERINGVRFSPDGRIVAFCTTETVHLWNTFAGKRLRQWKGHTSDITTVAFRPDGRQLASGSRDTTILLWDIDEADLVRSRDKVIENATLEQLWKNLAAVNTRVANRSIDAMIAAGPKTATFLAQRLQPVGKPDEAEIRRLIADLDAPKYAVRQQSHRRLMAMERTAGALLAVAQKANPDSAELKSRLQMLLRLAQSETFNSPKTIQTARALRVLERIGTAKSIEALKAMAGGNQSSKITQYASRLLKRATGAARKQAARRKVNSISR